MTNSNVSSDLSVSSDVVGTEVADQASYEEMEVTTMTTLETIPAPKNAKLPKLPREKKAPRTKTPYPFMSKGQIALRIQEDDGFMLSCLQTMFDRQTAHEQDTNSTKESNRRGFMASHAENGTLLAKKAQFEGLTTEETDKARSIVARYTKQLASHFRDLAIEANPSLAAIGKLFSV